MMMGIMLLFWAAIFGGLAWLAVKGAPLLTARTEGPGRAEDILRERYARGEIDLETFERMRDEVRR